MTSMILDAFVRAEIVPVGSYIACVSYYYQTPNFVSLSQSIDEAFSGRVLFLNVVTSAGTFNIPHLLLRSDDFAKALVKYSTQQWDGTPLAKNVSTKKEAYADILDSVWEERLER